MYSLVLQLCFGAEERLKASSWNSSVDSRLPTSTPEWRPLEQAAWTSAIYKLLYNLILCILSASLWMAIYEYLICIIDYSCIQEQMYLFIYYIVSVLLSRVDCCRVKLHCVLLCNGLSYLNECRIVMWFYEAWLCDSFIQPVLLLVPSSLVRLTLLLKLIRIFHFLVLHAVHIFQNILYLEM